MSLIPGISESSSIRDLISVLRTSPTKEYCDEVERLLVIREENLKQEHCGAVYKGASIQADLNDCRVELYKSEEQASRLRAIGETVCKKHSKAKRQLHSVAEELLRVEEARDAEIAKRISELAKANEEALEKLRAEHKNSLDDLSREVDLLREQFVKGLELHSNDHEVEGHLTAEDLHRILAVVKDAVAPLIPAAVTSTPLEVSSAMNN